MKNIPMIPYAAGDYIEVADGVNIHRSYWRTSDR